MSIKTKIFTYLIVWALLSAGVFFYAIPKFIQSLIDLQNNHQQEISMLSTLQAQASSLHIMEGDLQAISQDSIQPDDLFSTDVHLVNEFKYLETIAEKTNTKLILNVTGTADQEALATGTRTHLAIVPYTINLVGAYPDIVNFVQYMENAYFISPISGINLSNAQGNTQGGPVSANILTNTYITVQ